MSLRMLQKQCGVEPTEVSRDTGGGRHAGRGGGRGQGGAKDSQGYPEQPRVMAPVNRGGFHGSRAQAAHIEATKAAMREEAARQAEEAAEQCTDLTARSSRLGLDALKERQRKEDEERWQRREAARAKRHGEESKREIEEEQAIAECEEQARIDSEEMGVKYEAALIVRIAVRFGTAGVWMKIAEARARGANIPLDPKRIYVLAHPDKCSLQEASDATAILNAQRPPEMTEVAAKPRPKAMPSQQASSAPAPPPHPSEARGSSAKKADDAPEASSAKSSAEVTGKLPAALQKALEDALEQAKLTRYQQQASDWCTEMGAIGFEEVRDSADDFCAALGLKPLERKRLLDVLGSEVSASTTSESTSAPKASASAVAADKASQKRDPEDGQACTLEELRKKYAGQYSPEEIEAYWEQECKAIEEAPISVSSRPAPKSKRF